MTRKELLQIPGLGDVLKSLEDSPPPKGALEPPPKCPPNLAAPGEIWRVVENDQQTEDQGYSRTNPHCSTVIILRRQEEPAGEHAVFRAAPVLADIRYCGVEDAIFPREVFGYEAAVACGCEFTLTSKELERCEGVLPDEWFDRLADFAAWMEAEDDETAPAFPPLLKTGRPFTHPEDPGYIFHANLATNLQPLMATVLEDLTESAAISDKAVRLEPSSVPFGERVFGWIGLSSLKPDLKRALAAGESHLPEQIDVSRLLPGFTVLARGSVRRPGEATVFTFSCPVKRESQPPPDVVVSWPPDGSSRPCVFRENFGLWMAEIEIELRYRDAVSLHGEGKIAITSAQ
jgi:hypothetical protein